MYSQGLQYIRVSVDRVVLKRGINELLLSGSGVESIVERLVGLLDGTRSREQIVAAFPEDLQPEVQTLLTGLIHRRLITQELEETSAESDRDALQERFWSNFGEAGLAAPARLRQAKVVVVGANLITRALVRSLLEMNIGAITLVDHPILNNELASIDQVSDTRLRHLSQMPANEELIEVSLLCGASDFSLPEPLIEMNRMALSLGKPYLPLWLIDQVGYAGPLTYPFESACLRCYQLRADSNNPNYQAAHAIREHMAGLQARQSAGLLPPMAGILGEIGALEVAKAIAGFPPSDVVSRIIEVNMLSFRSTVRRVLKVPRCPDCSDIMKKPARALTVAGPIPNSE